MNPHTNKRPRRLSSALGIGAGCFLTAMAMQANAASSYLQSFESDTANWTDNVSSLGSGYGTITRVASGTNGITSPDGGFHALLTGIASGPSTIGPVTNFGGYSSVWPGDFVSEVSVYIDPAQMGADGGFDYSLAINGQNGNHRRDFAFLVTNDASEGSVLLNVGFGSALSPNTDLELMPDTATLSAVGWYTLRSTFVDDGGILSVQMDVLDPNNITIFTSTLSDPTDDIATIVGGNRYGWFAALDMTSPLAVDNVNVTLLPIPEPTAAALAFAGVAMIGFRRRRSAI